GDEVGTRLRVDALIPQIGEISETFAENLLALLFAFYESARDGNGGAAIRPVAELSPVLEREVEQRRQHLHGQLNRDLVDPVERFAARQTIERLPHATADQP